MSQENVEVVRSIYADWEKGDFKAAQWAHPEIEYELPEIPGTGPWKGVAGMAEGFRAFVHVWEGYRVAAEDYRDLGDERVLVFVHYRGRGKTSGLDLEQMAAKGAHLFHIRGDKVTKFVAYVDRERALADLGLSD